MNLLIENINIWQFQKCWLQYFQNNTRQNRPLDQQTALKLEILETNHLYQIETKMLNLLIQTIITLYYSCGNFKNVVVVLSV